MSKEKFTQGEWRVQRANKIGHGNEAIKHIVRMESGNKNRYQALPYAALGGFPDEGAKEEIEANSYLIATAPEMYECLKMWVTMVEHGNTDHIDINVHNAESTKKLLAKARGE